MPTTYPTGTDDERETAIEAAAEAVQRGGLVVLPTDTVYGLGADAFDHSAVQALLDAKGRGREMPPPVLISSATTLDALATSLPAYVGALTEAFWPGPLTLVCVQQPSLSWDLGETRGTVAVRMPDHEVALALLERTGPLAVSSANLSGLPAATEAAAAEGMLGDNVEVVIDAGTSPKGEASTILDVRGDKPRVLRLGALSVTDLNDVLRPLGAALPTEDDEDGEDVEPDDGANADDADEADDTDDDSGFQLGQVLEPRPAVADETDQADQTDQTDRTDQTKDDTKNDVTNELDDVTDDVTEDEGSARTVQERG